MQDNPIYFHHASVLWQIYRTVDHRTEGRDLCVP